MKEIQLSQGKVALVSDHWFEELNKYKWYAKMNGNSNIYYAVRQPSWSFGKRKIIYMHRAIMGDPIDMEVDHIDRNTLNNQVENLRLCTRSQNMRNTGKRTNSASSYKGVSKNRSKWDARLRINGKIMYRGLFSTPEEAAHAYDEAAKKHFGEFANLNFPESES